MKFHSGINWKNKKSKIMALSVLILCIVSMTSFHPVASNGSFQLSSDSAPLLDFGFSRLIDDLIPTRSNSTNRKKILAVMAEVKKQLETLGKDGYSFGELIMYWMKHNTELNNYGESTDKIEILYAGFKGCLMDDLSCFLPNHLERLAEECLYEDLTISNSLKKFRSTDPLTGKNFMDLLIENMDLRARAGECSRTDQSPQSMIYNIYRRLVITTVKASAMMMYAYNVLRKRVDHGYVAEKRGERRNYETTIRNFQKSAVSAMTHASREICSFNDVFAREELKYIELKWLFNTIVTNEAYLNEGNSCWGTCDDYQETTFYQYSPQPLNELNMCYGRIHNCFQQTVNSYCPARKKESRRFHGLLPKKMGKTKCHSKNDISNKVSNGAFDRCDQCICYCDDYERHDTIRIFSLKAVRSDTLKNRVITGIQFIEKNRKIYLRIQDGELKPNGTVKRWTVEWQPVDEIDFNSPFASPDDFIIIRYNEKFVNLDTLIVPAGRVLTGIKLRSQGLHLGLAIETHVFNYSSGILEAGSHDWTWVDQTVRQEIMMIAPDNPIHMNQTVMDRRENTFVTFRMTDLEKDAGQTAVPFIDAQPVISNPPVPLSGAGIYYSGQAGYGGVIGVKAVAYDFLEVLFN